MKGKMNYLPLLVAASTLAIAGLIFFQYKWITHSKELHDQVFHQRACMALCSTLEEYGEGVSCNMMGCGTSCTPGCGSIVDEYQREEIIYNPHFLSDLRKTLDFYNIDLSYQVAITDTALDEDSAMQMATCVVNLPSHTEQEGSFILLDFPDRPFYVLDNLKFMIGASFLILLFTSLVLIFANWWLLQQKKLLKANIDIYNNMAHEFKTPLANIHLASAMLAKGSGKANQNQFIDIIARENDKLIQQVDRVLYLARMDNRDYTLQKEPVHLNRVIHQVLEEFQLQIENRQAKINVSPLRDDLIVPGDPSHLANAIRNIIDNALKYTRDKPEISISIETNLHNVVISISDNGIGIPEGESKMIFEKFHRLSNGDLHDVKGFGLGLAYVKKIIELHKGSIEVASQTDKGTTFNISLPRAC